jgi:chromosome segregation protein
MLSLIEVEQRFEPVLRHLLQDTYLVDGLGEAIGLMQTMPRRATLVTAEGDVLTPSGAITGGGTGAETRGVLGRGAEIESLEASLGELEARAAEGERNCETLARQLDEQVRRRDDLIHKLDEVRAGRARVTVEADRLIREGERLAQAVGQLTSEREGLDARREDYEAQRRQSAETAARLAAETERIEQAVAAAESWVVRAQSQHTERAAALADVRVRVAELAKSVEETDREHQRLQRETESVRAEAGRRAQAIDDFRAQCTLLEHDITSNLERSKALADSREEARSGVVESENHRQGLLDESDGIEKSLKTLREQAREAQSEVHRIEIDLRHDEDQLEFFRERILTEYHVALASLTEEEIGADDHEPEARERMIQEIRERLERLGPVNLMAIEEYEALKERHEFLAAQDADLRAARESLTNVIERIDKTITEMFVQTFTAVAENFKNYFRRVFNGGQARLYLVDENDPLECGIEIEARPPGKRPQTLSLLSGGEQAMTAIALLFSIFKAKPSAFCVLDEVDAPLDDANIGRFVSLVEEFAADTQFVVITHNKQTMAQADALYGVTQQERGISQIVSVRLGDVREGAAA